MRDETPASGPDDAAAIPDRNPPRAKASRGFPNRSGEETLSFKLDPAAYWMID